MDARAVPPPSDLVLLRNCEQLQMMPVRVIEVDAAVISWSAVDEYTGRLQYGLHLVVLTRFEAKRHVVHLATGVDVFAVPNLEESDLLGATAEKALPGAFVCHPEAE